MIEFRPWTALFFANGPLKYFRPIKRFDNIDRIGVFVSISSRHRVVPNNVFKFLNHCTRELVTRKNREKIY